MPQGIDAALGVIVPVDRNLHNPVIPQARNEQQFDVKGKAIDKEYAEVIDGKFHWKSDIL